MAIDLFCYSTKNSAHTQKKIGLLAKNQEHLFSSIFLLSPVQRAAEFHKEIALEYGIKANSMFLVRLNDKSAAGLLPTVEAALKEALGFENIVILLENETLR